MTIRDINTGKFVRVSETFEEKAAEKEKEIKDLFEWTRIGIEPNQAYIDAAINALREDYKARACKQITTDIDILYQNLLVFYRENLTHPALTGILLTRLFQGLLGIVQNAEHMEWVPKDTEICSTIIYQIDHVPVWEELWKTNHRVHRALLEWANILISELTEISKRKLDGRVHAWFVHKPTGAPTVYPNQAGHWPNPPHYADHIEPLDDDHPDKVPTLRELVVLLAPKNTSTFNMALHDHMSTEIWKVMTLFDQILRGEIV